MRWWLLCVVFVAACSKKDPEAAAPAPEGSGARAEKPHHHEDRHEVQEGPTKLAITVAIAGQPAATWDAAAFAKVPKIDGKASDGEARDTWSLKDLAHALVGPNARVTAVIGADGKVAIDEAKWTAPDATPILHSTRRGSLKFRWTDKDGKWGDTAAKDVSGLEIQP